MVDWSFRSVQSLMRRSRFALVVFFVLGCLLLVRVAEYTYVSYLDSHWESIVESTSTDYVLTAERAFASQQRSVRTISTSLAQRPVIQEYLLRKSTDLNAVFDEVSHVSAQYRVGVEVYNADGVLVAWEGTGGAVRHREIRLALAGQLVSYVNTTPIYSQLFVTTPVRAAGLIVGVIVVRRSIEVTYPLSNKYIQREGLADRLSDDLGVPVEFNFLPDAAPRKDGRFVSAPLLGIDSARVGVVSIMRPVRSGYLETVADGFHSVEGLLVVVLLVLLAWRVLAFLVQSEPMPYLRCLAVAALVWGIRYALLWLDIPSSYLASSIFDPAYFASKFGSGLAKSIGEMLITALALVTTIILIARILLNDVTRHRAWWYPRGWPAGAVLALAAAGLIPGLLRGYAAIIRSAVFDSTFQYNDPRAVFPSFELAFMMVSLFIITFSLIVVTTGLSSYVLGFCSRIMDQRKVFSRYLAIGSAIAVAVLFGVIHPTPLTSTWYRIVFVTAVLLLALAFHWQTRHHRAVISVRNAAVVMILAVAFFYPLLDEFGNERDRERMRVYAAEVLRPVDGWLQYIVDEALRDFSSDETVDVLLGGRPDDIGRIAFTHWARSAISREGYNCLFALMSPDGGVLSRFEIGGSFEDLYGVDLTINPDDDRNILVSERGTGVNAVKVYTGTTPVFAGTRRVVAFARVVVVAGQQTLFRGESPAILRSSQGEGITALSRPLFLTEYRSGRLFTTTSPDFPVRRALPAEVAAAFADSSLLSFWHDDVINDVDYEVYYARASRGSPQVIAVGIPHGSVGTMAFALVKVLVYALLLFAAGILFWLLTGVIRGRRYQPAFRDRLLVAMLVIAVIPLVIIGVYGRITARDRLLEMTRERLERETAAIVLNLKQTGGGDVLENSFPPGLAESIAANLGTDFNVYHDSSLVATSRPELYEAGILDGRLSGNAYNNILDRGKRFYVQTEMIGRYQYAVGYRPVLNNSGSVSGIVSVPTLYRQDAIDEEVARRNALLFAVYTVAMLGIAVIATTMANRIASPIHRLTGVTKKVAQGDLNVQVDAGSADGEIGELVSSFSTMIRELRRSRESLVRYERELAWKEMAKQVAHEIKNPLTPMKLTLQHLRDAYADAVPDFGDIFRRGSRMMIDQIDALSRIASEFSRFARMPDRTLEPCDVNGVLDDAINLFEQDTAITWERKRAPNLPFVMADREELRRAFINVLRNGIQAQGGAGRMTVESRRNGGSVIVTIEDSGPGIPEEIKEKLFQPNFSTKTDGMGLGLAIVKKTIDDLEGSITIESELGRGTTVIITLPAP